MNILSRVRNRLARYTKAHPFLIGAFYDLGSARQVCAAFAVCVKTGELKRLARGVYARPKHIRFSNKPYFGSAEDLARLWAKQFGYVLVPQAMESAYRVGLQTQMPLREIYWTNGHSRKFQIGNELIEVRKRQNQSGLLLSNTPAGVLYRGLSVFEPRSLKLQQLQTACERLALTENERAKMKRRLLNSDLHPCVQQLLIQL